MVHLKNFRVYLVGNGEVLNNVKQQNDSINCILGKRLELEWSRCIGTLKARTKKNLGRIHLGDGKDV